ncbi:DUF502 domain-containing protein [candidate division KSB1 bacterium]|nr:DUF502 domain-containing protein [candidate division KSB1 bacterium]
MEGAKNRLGKRLRGYFVAGLLVVIPLALTAYVVWQLFVILDGLLSELVSQAIYRGLGVEPSGHSIPGIGLLALLLTIVLIGMVARNFIGNKAIRLGGMLLNRIPVIRHIYGTFQQISQAFLSDHSEVFKRAALIEYPRKGIYSIGFITQDTKGVVQQKVDKDLVSVFLPTTPNPTSGYLLFVPKAEVILLNITVEEALKLVISGGAIVPMPLPPKQFKDSFGIETKPKPSEPLPS